MNRHTITITPVTEALLPAVVHLVSAQDTRHFAQDTRLRRGRSQQQIEAKLRREMQEGQPLVALDAQKRVRGYVAPSVWTLKETSMLRSFLTARNGVALNLTFPDPSDTDVHSVTFALLDALNEFWEQHGTTGDLIRWPSRDTWIEPLLVEHAFQLDSVCAFHPRQPLLRSSRLPETSFPITTRLARPEDEETLIHLLDEELRFHELYTPFVRSSPQVLNTFRRKLAKLWNGESLEQGAPLIIVAEREGEVVAMGENTLLVLGPDDEPGFTPAGRYACIDNVSVGENARGQGIGRLLVEAAFAAFTPTPFDAYLLWYNPDNVLAGQVWPHLGFQPLWTTYQQLHEMP